ncbi:MAG: hypothetical protein KDE19_22890, partial [Caldilineaceae bacterium]|nr:hypothetical protein [Caldilineaceae bacterium]
PYAIGNWVTLPTTTPTTYRLFTGDLVEEKRPWHHSPEKLAARLLAVYQELCTATDASHSFDVTPRTV